MKKYQSGGKTSKATAKSNFSSPRDSVQTARDISSTVREYAKKSGEFYNAYPSNRERPGAYTPRTFTDAQQDSASVALGKYLDKKGFKKGEGNKFSVADKNEISRRALTLRGELDDRESPASKYKKGGTIKNQTSMKKQKPAPKKKVSAKEMEAMKKANTPMMKYGGKIGKKPC